MTRSLLSPLDLAAIRGYFAVLLWIGVRVMPRPKEGDSVHFSAAPATAAMVDRQAVSWKQLLGWTAGLLSLVLVSLLTQHSADEDLEIFSS